MSISAETVTYLGQAHRDRNSRTAGVDRTSDRCCRPLGTQKSGSLKDLRPRTGDLRTVLVPKFPGRAPKSRKRANLDTPRSLHNVGLSEVGVVPDARHWTTGGIVVGVRARVQPNLNLVCIFRKHLLVEFGQHDQFDPWWWPVGPGETLHDWGLQQGEEAKLDSLRTLADGSPYNGFPGSIGGRAGGTWVISTRPSPERFFPVAVRGLFTCLLNADMLHEAHVTDLCKFRGRGPDNQKNEGMTPAMWECSIRCLLEEHAALNPRRIFFTRGAKGWFKERKASLHRDSQMRREWRLDSHRCHLDDFLTKIENHPNSAVVPFWRRVSNASGTWRSTRQNMP